MTKHTPYTVLWIIPYDHAYFSAKTPLIKLQRVVDFPFPR